MQNCQIVTTNALGVINVVLCDINHGYEKGKNFRQYQIIFFGQASRQKNLNNKRRTNTSVEITFLILPLGGAKISAEGTIVSRFSSSSS